MLIEGPLSKEWTYGQLPPPTKDTRIVLWSKEYIGVVIGYEDILNQLKWCDDSFMPRWGFSSPIGWWTVI